MDFTLSNEIEDVRQRTRAFVAAHITPLEDDRSNYDEHENIRLDLCDEIRARVKAQGLWCPQVPKERGGMGLPFVGQAVMYEEANYSIFGPVCFNCAAPDDGNMRVLNQLGTEEQKEKWLQPIIDGKARGAIVMTEPHPGGGSDPTMIRTTAEPKGNDKWVINGHKWFITGAGVADHFILIARTSDEPRRQLTAFMVHKDTPGFELVRKVPIMGPEEHGGHCELKFTDMEIPDENRLLEVGRGMKVAQTRLGPARLTHCMRWLGLAKRSMEIAQDYINERMSFGIRLADRESVQLMMGEMAKEIHIGRLLVMNAAWTLDQGDFARKEISMAKVHCANMLHKVVDTAIQLNGARGYSKDTILEWIYRSARQARILDGADEVHKMVLANAYRAEGRDFWSWGG
ncbi:MAG: acyl-CoA dehydrogenase family protein [Proteobacteria bacterium]|nr:acyl-CoA dehydrogenase family protein [Pseudomonadota bacterium]